MGWFKRSFLYLLIIGLLLGSGGYLFILAYEDEIKTTLIQQLNQHLLGKMQVDDMSIAPFQNFPSVAVSLDEAVLKKENFGDQEKVAAFEHVYVSLNFYELVQGRYVVEKILLENGALNLRVDQNGNKNYQIFSMDKREDAAPIEGESNFYFDVQQIRITQTSFLYKSQIKEIAIQGFFDEVNLEGRFKDQNFKLKADLKSLVKQFKIEKVNYIEQKKVNLQTTLQVDGENDLYEVKQGNLRIAGADFNLEGEVKNKAKAYELNVQVNGKENRLSTLLALLPEHVRNKFDQYQGEGQIQFQAAITGKMSPIHNPRINVDFGIEDGTIERTDVSQKLTGVNFQGRFTNGNQKDLVTSFLKFEDFEARLNGREVLGGMSLNNFKNPYLNLDLKTNVNLKDANDFLQLSGFKEISGDIILDGAFAGRIDDLKQVETIHKANFKGNFNLKDVNIIPKEAQVPYKELNGDFRFNGDDLLIKHFEGYVANSDFDLSGRVNNLSSFIFLPDEQLQVEADLTSDKIDIEPLIKTEYNQEQQDSVVTFALPDYLDMDLKLEANNVKYYRFSAQNVEGALDYHQQQVDISGLDFESMNGRIQLNGSFANSHDGNLEANLNANCQQINIHQLFHEFYNFGQDFITKKQLKGTLNADIDLSAHWDEHLNALNDSLRVNADLSIEQGELVNFKPITKLAGFIKIDKLKHLKFQKLANNVRINDRMIEIPQMEIRSDKFDMSMMGTHTFNDQIDYRFQVNISDILFGKKEDYQTEYGKVVYEENGNMNLFVHMMGDAADPQLKYDRQAVTDKIKTDLQTEGEELKEALKKDEQNNNEGDDYELEWDDE